jgi:hypothetical protein
VNRWGEVATHNGVRVDDEVNPSPHLLASLLLNKAGGEKRAELTCSLQLA